MKYIDSAFMVLPSYSWTHTTCSINYNSFFSKERSTKHSLITLVDNITQSLDEGSMLIGIFLDLKKAFGYVDHSIFFRKLCANGIRGSMHT